MNYLPRISIVTPSFNQAQFVERTLCSVIDQGYPDMEYIVLDGGSTDGSADIIKKYSSSLTYWESGPDGGQAAAIKKGIEMSTGDIVSYLNSDDLLLPGALMTIGKYFANHPTVETVSTASFHIDKDDRPIRDVGAVTLGVSASFNRLRFYAQDGLFQPSVFYRRRAYDAAGGVDPSWEFIMDYDLFTRLARVQQIRRYSVMTSAHRIHAAMKSMTIQDVRERELIEYRAKYLDGTSSIQRAVYGAYYRNLSLLRKSAIVILRTSGIVHE